MTAWERPLQIKSQKGGHQYHTHSSLLWWNENRLFYTYRYNSNVCVRRVCNRRECVTGAKRHSNHERRPPCPNCDNFYWNKIPRQTRLFLGKNNQTKNGTAIPSKYTHTHTCKHGRGQTRELILHPGHLQIATQKLLRVISHTSQNSEFSKDA